MSVLPAERPPASPLPAASASPAEHSLAQQPCRDCAGSGGWYRYEPALEPAPGLMYLSCLQCHGRGWMAVAAQA